MARRIKMDTGDAVLVDALGAKVIRTEPAGEIAVMLDLEGTLNKLDIRDAHRYLFAAGQAAELIAELVVAAQYAVAAGAELGLTDAHDFAAELVAAISAAQDRIGLKPRGTE